VRVPCISFSPLDASGGEEKERKRVFRGTPPRPRLSRVGFFGGAGGETSLLGFGVPPMLLFLPLAARGGEENRKKKFCGDTPHPDKGLAALCNPAWRARRQKTYP